MWAVNFRWKKQKAGSPLRVKVFDSEVAAWAFAKDPPKDVIVFYNPWRL